MSWPPPPHTPERSEIKQVLHGFIADLTDEQKSVGSLLIREDDFNALWGEAVDHSIPSCGYKFGPLPLIVIQNPVRRVEYVDFRPDS